MRPKDSSVAFADFNTAVAHSGWGGAVTAGGSFALQPTYSINRLFSEFFRKFGGAFLEVCETISEGIWQVLRGKIKENYPENKIIKNK